MPGKFARAADCCGGRSEPAYSSDMKSNRYESSRKYASKKGHFWGVGPLWLGVSILAAASFVWAISWLLTHPLPAV